MLKKNEPILQSLLVITDPEAFWTAVMNLDPVVINDLALEDSKNRLLNKFKDFKKTYPERYRAYMDGGYKKHMEENKKC